MPNTRARLAAAILVPLALTGFISCKKSDLATNELDASGLIEAIKTEVRAQTAGTVDQVLVREGQKVAKGDLLCVLNTDKLRLQLDQVRAGIEASRAKLGLVRMGTKKELIAVARNQADLAAKQLEIAAKDQERLTRLFSQGAVSQSQKEKADLALKAAQEGLQIAKENLQLAERGREKEEFDIVEAEIKGLQAQEALLVRTIADAEVRAPVSGYVEVRHVEAGELAGPGTALFSLIDPAQTYVKAYIPEPMVGRVKLGAEVTVRSDSFPGKTYRGRVDYVSDEAEFAPKNIQTKEERIKLVFMLKAYLDDAGGELKPGMPVDVKIRI